MPNANIICPNKSLAEWKALSDAIGEDRAYVAFFRNKDSIPTVEVARTLLGEAEPAKVTNTGATPLAKPTPPVPVAQSNLEILTKEGEVTVKIPKDAHVVRLTPADKTKKPIITTAKEMSSGINTYQGTPWAKIEAGSIGLTKRFVPLPRGVVEIKARVKQGEIEPAPAPPVARPAVTAHSIEQLREMLPTSGLSAGHQAMFNAILDSPMAPALKGFDVVVTDALEGKWEGVTDYVNSFMGISRTSNVGAVAHEFFHVLLEKLPPEVHQMLEQMRVDAINNRLADAGNDELIQQLKQLRDNPTSGGEQFVAQGFHRSIYHLSSLDEFGAHIFSDKFTGENLNPEQKTVWGQIRELFRSIVAAIKKFFKLPQSQEELLTNIIKGRYDLQPEGVVARDVQHVEQASLPAEPLPLEVGADGNIHLQNAGRDVTVTGTNKMTPVEIAAGKEKVIALMQRLKFPGGAPPPDAPEARNIFRVQPNDAEPVGYYDAEGRILIKELIESTQKQNLPGEERAFAPQLIRVINYNRDAFEKLFSPQVFEELNALSIEQASETAQKLALMQGMTPSTDLLEVVRNLGFSLRTIYAAAFGDFSPFTRRILEEFGKSFTDEELAAIAASQPKTEALVNKILAENAQDQGGRVYRIVQNLLKPKSVRRLSKLESDAKIQEAAQKIIEDAAKQGIKPVEKKGTPLSPVQKLLMMIQPENVEKLNSLISQAVKDAERNAGVRVALNAAPDRNAREELEARFYAGEDPTPEQVEQGLLLPEYAHWKVIRENILGYSPVTEKLAGKIIPKVTALAKELLATPNFLQPAMRQRFMSKLTDELGLPDDQAKTVWNALDSMYRKRAEEARTKAIAAAIKSMTPKEQEIMPKANKKLWDKIEQFFNAGGDNVGDLLKEVAKLRGYTMPTDAEIAQMKSLVDQEQRLRTPTQRQIDKYDGDVAKATQDAENGTEQERILIIQKLQANWSRWSQPISLKKWFSDPTIARNNAKAVDEFVAANLLLKVGFVSRQFMDVYAVSATLNMANRTLLHVIERSQNDGGFSAQTFKDLDLAIREMVTARISSAGITLRQAERVATGHTNRRVLERAQHSIGIFERMSAKADAMEAKGNKAGARSLRLMTLLQAGYRVASTFDELQAVGLEWQEMRHQLVTDLRKAGKNKAQVEMIVDDILGGMRIEMVEAIKEANAIGVERGLTKDKATLQSDAWRLIKAKAYDRMRAATGMTTDYQAENQQLRELHSWNLPEKGGVGGLIADTIKGLKSKTEKMGVPTGGLFSFGNAMGIAANRMLTFSGGGLFGGWGFGESEWYKGARNKQQRRLEAIEGLTAIGIVIALAAAGKLIIQTQYPKDPKEKERFSAEGHKLNTLLWKNDDGSWFEMPMQMSPLNFISPQLYMIGGVQRLGEDRLRAQAKLNAEAEKLGLTPGTVDPIATSDIISVLAQGMYGLFTGGRTASGMVQSFSDYGVFNLNKAVSRTIAPYIPGVPAWEEISRAMGAAMDTKTATMLELLVPNPWSPHQRVNALGDPMSNPNDAVRVLQVMTGGWGFGSGTNTKGDPSYAALFATDFSIPRINPVKGYNISGIYRPMTSDELEKYSVARGQYLKQGLAGLGGGATKEQVQQAYQEANSRALADVGVQSASKSGGTMASVGTAPRVGGQPRMTGFGGRTLRIGRGRTIRVARSVGIRGFGSRIRSGSRPVRMVSRSIRGRTLRGRSLRASRRRRPASPYRLA